MAILLNDNGYKYVLNWNPSTTNLELLKYGLTTFDYPSGEYLKTLVDTTIIGGSSFGAPIWGSWYDTTSQYTIANTATNMFCNNVVGSNGISIISNKEFLVQYGGVYNIQFSVQLDQASGSPHHTYIWLRKNGVDEPYSASEVAVQGSKAEMIPAWNFMVVLNANDYIELMWSVENASVHLKAVGAVAPVPAIPSVIITMHKL